MQDLRKKAEQQAEAMKTPGKSLNGETVFKRGTAAWQANEDKKNEVASNFFGKTPALDKMAPFDFRRSGQSQKSNN